MQTDNVKIQNESEAEAEDWKARAEEYLNNWKRERADFLNYKKEEVSRLTDMIKFANEGLILEVVELIDDLELTAGHTNGTNGLNQVLKKFYELLKKYGLARVETTGRFDPNLHEAVEGSEAEGKLEEIRAGWIMHGRVVRPARVRILK